MIKKFLFLANTKLVKTYFGIYLGTIVVFAFFYTLMNNSFYYSNIKLDDLYKAHVSKLYDNLQEDTIKHVNKRIEDGCVDFHDEFIYLFKRNSLLAVRGATDLLSEDKIRVRYSVDISPRLVTSISDSELVNTNEYVSHRRVHFMVTYNRFTLLHDDIIERDVEIDFLGVSESKDGFIYEPISIDDDYNLKSYFGDFEDNRNYVTISKETYDLLDGLYSAKYGKSDNVNGKFFRMLYLSMVTISTLGYGDIVPINTGARLLIGLESILGIVIMGLFINALYNQNQNEVNENEECSK